MINVTNPVLMNDRQFNTNCSNNSVPKIIDPDDWATEVIDSLDDDLLWQDPEYSNWLPQTVLLMTSHIVKYILIWLLCFLLRLDGKRRETFDNKESQSSGPDNVLHPM